MARFDLSQYATVAERLDMLYSTYPDAKIITKNITTETDRAKGIWVMQAQLWLPVWNCNAAFKGATKEGYDPETAWFLKSTGHAFEVEGGQGANATSALENAETSAVGRCLALANWNGNKNQKSLASREEMMKVERANTDWRLLADGITDTEELRKVYADARKLGASSDTLAYMEKKANELKGNAGA